MILLCYAHTSCSHCKSGYMRGSSTPLLGAAHGTDIPDFFGLGDKTDFTASDAISKYSVTS